MKYQLKVLHHALEQAIARQWPKRPKIRVNSYIAHSFLWDTIQIDTSHGYLDDEEHKQLAQFVDEVVDSTGFSLFVPSESRKLFRTDEGDGYVFWLAVPPARSAADFAMFSPSHLTQIPVNGEPVIK